MVTRREFATLAAGALAAPAYDAPARTGSPAPGGRAAEALALRRFAESTSPRGLEAAADRKWRAGWDRLQAQASSMPDGPYVVGLRRQLTWFNEGHTTVLPFEFLGAVPTALSSGVWGTSLPLQAKAFADGLFITQAADEGLALLGARVTSIEGVAIEKIVTDHIAAWPGENPAWGHNWSGSLLHSPGLLRGLGVISGPMDAAISIEARLPDGAKVSANIRPGPGAGHGGVAVERKPAVCEQLEASKSGGNLAIPLASGSALYVSIDDMADSERLSFDNFTSEILSSAQDPRIQRVVIDVRRNGGGDNYLGERLRHELARSRFNRPGGLYVLAGPATFSAAQNFANRLERETFALFVGEPTGSAPNLVGDAKIFVGAVTGITAMVATKRWFDGGPDDRRRWIFPDLHVPSLFADWLAGRDPALDAALGHVATDADDFGKRIRYFERASQTQEWNPYWASTGIDAVR